MIVPIRRFTLVELLIVVFLLAAVAATAVSVLDGADEQLRYDDTRARLSALRVAILGDERPEGRARASGFVADVGRLPATIDELLARPPSVAAFDPAFGFGWRGPYLALPPQRAGSPPRYPDGFGNDPGDPNHGWQLEFTPPPPIAAGTQLVLRSRGGATLGAPETTLRPEDGFVDASGLQVRVVFDDPDVAATLAGLGVSLRLRLHYPVDGAPAVLDSTDGGVFVPLGLPGRSALDFAFPSEQIPWGARRLSVVTAAGAPFGSGVPAQVLLLPRSSLPRFEMPWSVNP
ncbi:MAG: hypothetical protein D6731_04920 [Planctomycetota bacterium]|nr:MAG: hypothetical protein D6731_04920 [Planctomycetota bacterium]